MNKENRTKIDKLKEEWKLLFYTLLTVFLVVIPMWFVFSHTGLGLGKSNKFLFHWHCITDKWPPTYYISKLKHRHRILEIFGDFYSL